MTNESWSDLEALAFKTGRMTVPTHNDYAACILELRARVEALEAKPEAKQSQPALVTRVAAVISEDGEIINWFGAYDAIREVAAWLQSAGLWEASDALEQEVKR